MKYLLGIGPTILQKYKKNANLRIFLDDVMIDEFFVEEKNITNKQWIDKKNIPLNPWKPSPTPKTHKTYIIDQSTLEGKRKLRIEVTNEDSNFTNGFMNKSTVIDFRHIFLLPIQFIKFFKFSTFSHTEGKGYQDMCNNIGPIIHEKFGGQVDFVRLVYNHTETDRFFGYPYPFRIFWNDKPTFGHLGGSGVLTIDLIQRSGIYLFDSIDDEFPEDLLHIDNHNCAPRVLSQVPNPDSVVKAKEQQVKITGLLLSRLFLFWCQLGKLDKYLYEDK